MIKLQDYAQEIQRKHAAAAVWVDFTHDHIEIHLRDRNTKISRKEIDDNTHHDKLAKFFGVDKAPEAAEPSEPIMQFFEFGHLPEHLQDASRPFMVLAINIINTLPRNPERTVALRKLLESKDAAVRAKIYKTP